MFFYHFIPFLVTVLYRLKPSSIETDRIRGLRQLLASGLKSGEPFNLVEALD